MKLVTRTVQTAEFVPGKMFAGEPFGLEGDFKTVERGEIWITAGAREDAGLWPSVVISGELAVGSGFKVVGSGDYGTINGFDYPVTRVSPISGSTWEELDSISNEEIKNKSSELLSYISLDAHQYTVENTIQQKSEVLLDVRSENEAVIEWIFKNFRIGFTVNTDPVESGWFLASKGNLGNITGEGHLPDTNIHLLVSWLSYFARISYGY